MKRFSWVLGVCAAGAMFGACGDDGGGGATNVKTAAKRTPENAASLDLAIVDAESGGGLGAMGQLYADLQVIYMDKQTKELQSRAGGLEYAYGALTAGCVQTTGDSATYTNCAEGPSTFNGTARVDGDNVTFDVTIDVDPDAYNGPIAAATAQGGAGAPKMTMNAVAVHETGNLVVGDTKLTGTVDAQILLDMTIEIPGFGTQPAPQQTDIHAVFDVTRDASGCPVGGTLTVTSSNITATAEYGPACGDVKLL